MPTLKQAQADPSAMMKFVAEHSGLEVEGDHFDAVMGSMSQGKPKATLAASSKDDCDDYT